MEFPTKENDLEVLARNLTAGLTAHAEVFPEPPVTPTALAPVLVQLDQVRQTLATAEGAYKAALAAKNELLVTLAAEIKKDLRYAENLTNYDPSKLAMIGWGGRKEPAPPLPPGSPRDLTAEVKEQGHLILSWLRPAKETGGSVRAYRIHRRDKVDGVFSNWQEISTALETEAWLENQPEGCVMEYRIVSTNTSGSSLPSNTVSVIL
jgi:hypothetical protein